MLYYIEGKLVLKTEDCAVIDCGGVAYRLRATAATLSAAREARRGFTPILT